MMNMGYEQMPVEINKNCRQVEFYRLKLTMNFFSIINTLTNGHRKMTQQIMNAINHLLLLVHLCISHAVNFRKWNTLCGSLFKCISFAQ